MDPITIPTSFLKRSARVPVTETAGSLEAYVEDMLRFVEDMEQAVELRGNMEGTLGNDVMSLDRPQRSRLRQPETIIKKKLINYSACPNSRDVRRMSRHGGIVFIYKNK